VGALEPKFYLAFNQAIGRKNDLSDLIAPPEKQLAIREEIQALLLQKTRAEWEAIFASLDVCCEPVLETDELEAHPLHQARHLFFTVDHPTLGPVKQLRTPVGAPEAKSVGPKLGQHSDEILAAHGFSTEEIAGLRRDKVVG
jgi:alpha-methylacyl-CoA racemase